MTNPEKENRINAIMDSLDGISRAGANPWLADKILNRINSLEYVSRKRVIQISIATVALITINIFIIGLNIKQEKNSGIPSTGSVYTTNELFNY